MQDDKLLTQYAHDGSQAAFSQLVARHLPLVYSTCLRETNSASLAEDAAQVVFLLLARKSKSLHAGPSLGGWLYQTARFVSKDVRKQEARRQRREQSVMQEIIAQQEPAVSSWERVEPLLNDALSALKPPEREAVLLRFIEGHSLAETGAALGVSEDAARMRVSRAVEKMQRYLAAHGATVTGIILTGFLTSEAARPVPAAAAATITQGTIQATSGAGAVALAGGKIAELLEGVYRTMWMTKVKIAIFTAAVLLVGAALPPLARAFHPHKASVQGEAQAPSIPLPLKERLTTPFTLDKDQHAYYSIALPKGASMIILDVRRADGKWGNNKSGNTTSSLSYLDKNGKLIQGDTINHDTVSLSFQEVEDRMVDQPILNKPASLILNIHNEGERCNYWLTVFPTASAVSNTLSSTSTSEASPALAVPLFGETVPKRMAVGETKTGRLEKNGYAYFTISLKAGRYQSFLDFNSVSSKSTDLNGDLTLSDEQGNTINDTFIDINELHGSDSSYRDVSKFILKKGGIFLIKVSNQGGETSEPDTDAVNFTARILPDGAVLSAKQN